MMALCDDHSAWAVAVSHRGAEAAFETGRLAEWHGGEPAAARSSLLSGKWWDAVPSDHGATDGASITQNCATLVMCCCTYCLLLASSHSPFCLTLLRIRAAAGCCCYALARFLSHALSSHTPLFLGEAAASELVRIFDHR